MKARGFSVHVVSSPDERLQAFAKQEGVPVYSISMTREISPLRDLRALVNLSHLLLKLRPTIVHAHTPKAGILGMVAAALSGVPVRIYQIRGFPFLTASGVKRILLKWTEWVSCILAHQVLCNSHSLREVAIAEGISPRKRIKVLLNGSGNGVDAVNRFNPALLPEGIRSETRRRFGITPTEVVIGFIGRIVKDKGIVELIHAWQRLRRENPDVHLMVVGPFESRDAVPESTRRILEEDPRVHLAGEDWDTPVLYRAMDLVVLPSYREGFPNVPLEASAMELPVVATRIPGCVDAVEDRTTGLLVPARDSVELARAIQLYLADPALRGRHGKAGRRRVLSQFEQETLWQALANEYVRLLTNKKLLPKGIAAQEAAA